MNNLAIAIDVGHLIQPNARLTADVFPNLAAAVRQVVALAHQEWVEYALGKPLPGGLVIQNRTGEYARSILFRDTGPFSGVVESLLPYAKAIEEGAPERDLKRMLNSSFKVRLTKDGRRYLIIPFRHGQSGTPDSVLNWWTGKQASHVTGSYRRASGTGAYGIRTRQLVTVPGWRYQWGDRLDKSDLASMGVTGTAAKRMEGMVRFANPGHIGGGGGGGKAGGGAKTSAGHGQMVTFRVMIEGGRGWIAKATPGKYPARTVADQVRPLAERLFAAAVAADVQAMLGKT